MKVTRKQLKQLIENKNWKAVEHANVSGITNMSYLFHNTEFNGKLSNWNVSNVVDMSWMFACSKFVGDISNWANKP